MSRVLARQVERLIDAYMEDEAGVLAKVGLAEAPAAKRQRSREAADITDADADVTCGVCFCDCAPAEASALSCGHRFCNDCWIGHLTSQIGDGNAEHIRCMAHQASYSPSVADPPLSAPPPPPLCSRPVVVSCVCACVSMRVQCPTLVEPSLAQALLDSCTYAKFLRFAQRQFVDDNPFLKFCPAAECDKVIKVADLGRTETTCTCGLVFCFRCSRPAHFPMSCALLTRWEDRSMSDAADGQWIQANTVSACVRREAAMRAPRIDHV